MAWNYSAVPKDSTTDSSGRIQPVGLKILKTFVDESGTELFTTEATIEEALVEAESGFTAEYAQAARDLFGPQLEYLLNYSTEGRQEAPSSYATVLGFELRLAVETLNRLAGISA
jgi:hypothetical protein